MCKDTKCDFVDCNMKMTRPISQYGKKRYHRTCATKKVALLYQQYYNKNESWAIMIRLINQWEKIYGLEFMLYTLSKAIREGLSINYFKSLRTIVFSNRNYVKSYDNYKNPKDNLIFDNVIIDRYEYNILLEKLGNNLKKLEYYIRRLNDYIIKSGISYDSHYDTILRWYEMDEDKKVVKYKEKFE